MNTHAESFPDAGGEPAAQPKFSRSYIVTVIGDEKEEPLGRGARAHEIRHLENTVGPEFVQALRRFYKMRLDGARVGIVPVFEQRDGLAIQEFIQSNSIRSKRPAL